MKEKKFLIMLLFSLTTSLFFAQTNEIQNELSAILKTEAYKINYPSDWDKDESGMMGTTFLLFAQPDSDTDQFKENVNLVIQDLTGMNIDMDQYVNISVPQIKQIITDASFIENKRITDRGKEHHKLSYTGKQGDFNLRFEQLLWLENEKAYVLTFTAENKSYDMYKDLGMKIMHSFVLN